MATDDVPTVKIEALKPVRALQWTPTFLDEAVHRRGDVLHVEFVRDDDHGRERYVVSLDRKQTILLAQLLTQHGNLLPVHDADEKGVREYARIASVSSMRVMTTKPFDVVSQDDAGGATFHDEYETWDAATRHALHIKGLAAWQTDHVYVRDHRSVPSKLFEVDETWQCKEVVR